MFKSIISIMITLFLGAASIFFFYEHNFIIAVLLLVWFLSRLFGYNLRRLAKSFGELTTHSDLETRCNCALEFNIALEGIFRHPSIDRLLKQLQRDNIIAPSIQKEDWIKTMLDNYNKTYGGEGLEKIIFNIKNNMLWKNGAIDFYDSVYHEIFIPYEYKDGKEKENIPLGMPEIEIGITIRLFIVNGIVKVQIGDFSKEYSPKLINSMTYQNYDTIKEVHMCIFLFMSKLGS